MIEIKQGIYLKINIEDFLGDLPINDIISNPEYSKYNLTPLNGSDLHITLCSNIEFKHYIKKFKNFDLSKIEIPELIFGEERLVFRSYLDKISLAVPIINQISLHKMMDEIFESVGLVYPEKHRFFHVTIANNGGGNKYSSIGNVMLEDFLPQNDGIDVYFDMDGVLADFDGYVNSDEIVIKHQNILFDKYPELKLLDYDEIRAYISDKPLIKELYKPIRDRIFQLANTEGFFLNLPIKEGAIEMLKKSIDLMGGKLPNILTAPMRNNHCAIEKRKWMNDHFKGLFNNIYVTENKHRVIRKSNDLLIDDRTKYCELFSKGGGIVIKHDNYIDTIKKLEKIFKDESN